MYQKNRMIINQKKKLFIENEQKNELNSYC